MAKAHNAAHEAQHAVHEQAPVAVGEGQTASEAPAVETIADEQRRRAAEIERIGAAAWVEAHDERTPEERTPRAVTGVAPWLAPRVEASTR